MRQLKVSQSKAEQIADYLREQIVSGELPPGKPLVIDMLAAEFGVSAIPVREALRQLDAEGFVQMIPYVGTVVSEVSATSIREVFGMLNAIEIISGRAACECMTDADLDRLEAMIAAMDTLTDQPDLWSQRNCELHHFICQCGSTSLLTQMLDRVFRHWDRLRHYYLNDVFKRRMHLAQREHVALLEALRQRDPELVALTVQYHNQSALRSYLNNFTQKDHVIDEKSHDHVISSHP